MKVTLQFNEQEIQYIFGNDSDTNLIQNFDVIVNNRKFEARVLSVSVDSFRNGFYSEHKYIIHAECVDKKAKEIAQAKYEVNRTKEAHKEAQRKLSALMEEK